MAKALAELMVNVETGERLLADDVYVIQHPELFVLFAAGDRAISKRRSELVTEREVQAEVDRKRVRAAFIAQGTRPLASDSAIAEAVKRAVRQNPDLELVHDDNGNVIAARPKKRPPAPMVTSGYLADK